MPRAYVKAVAKRRLDQPAPEGLEFCAYMRDPKPWQNVYECRFCSNPDLEEVRKDPDYEAAKRFGAFTDNCFVCIKPRSKLCHTAADANAQAKEWAEKSREAAASTNSQDVMWHTNAKFGETKIWKFLEPMTFDSEVNCFGFGRFYSVWTERANSQGYYKSNICLFSGDPSVGSFEFEFYAKKQPAGKHAEVEANRRRVAGERVAPPNSIAAIKHADKVAKEQALKQELRKRTFKGKAKSVTKSRKLISPKKTPSVVKRCHGVVRLGDEARVGCTPEIQPRTGATISLETRLDPFAKAKARDRG